MSNIPSIQWFPGHMAKTRRLMRESLPQVDAVVEIIDARIPTSSRNPEIDKILDDKPRIIVLNKSDCADSVVNNLWLDYFKMQGIPAMIANSKTGMGINAFTPLVKATLSDLIERRKSRGMAGMQLRIMIVGIPNVGKSSFINRLAGGRRAKVEDRPGVTRGRQWVTLNKDIELLDMPGMLWPKFEDETVGERLAFTGAIKDDILDIELLAMRLLEYLYKHYPDVLEERFKIAPNQDIQHSYDLLEQAAKGRGMLLSGGVGDTERAAVKILDEFRSGMLGRISLESPPCDGGNQ
ncbi:MAG: ribosome biogenesis GTPase YlqF [Clostridiales bacterium]|nr:ribosome biogenesis GTPase YlqF [Clostridiales bacterium]